MCIGLWVWGQDWSRVKAHFLDKSGITAVLLYLFFLRFSFDCVIFFSSSYLNSLPSILSPPHPSNSFIPSPSTYLWHTYSQSVLLQPSSLSRLILSQQGFKRAVTQQWPVTCHSDTRQTTGTTSCTASQKQPINLTLVHVCCLSLLGPSSYLLLPCNHFYQGAHLWMTSGLRISAELLLRRLCC